MLWLTDDTANAFAKRFAGLQSKTDTNNKLMFGDYPNEAVLSVAHT